ncbi:MAG: hypothetical protein Q7T16_06025 [Candidatus Burarchaeum sp.]|nr:hypothetical protein [Candidatus Burarchaeum sp.]MDO8340185.1 hypothetical protein [Candidatus Burarchaeum sp.]
MAKKRRGLAGFLWGACVWFATGFYHLLYILAKKLFLALKFLVGKLFSKASSAASSGARQASRPRSTAAYASLAVQKQDAGQLEDFEQRLLTSKSTIGLILGARGSGKSALGMRLLENVAAKGSRQVCAMGFDEASMPGWIRCVESVDEVPNGAFVLVDEGGITFSSRSSMSSANKLLSALLLVARHKDVSALFISQNSANLELNAIRQADYLLMRKPSLLQKDFERKKIGEIYAGIVEQFAGLPEQGRYSTYVYSDQFRGFVANELPSFWSQRASKSFASLNLKKK